MPLIIMVGLPCSGKTRRAREIATLLEAEISEYNAALATAAPSKTAPKRTPFEPKVVVVNEEALRLDRATSYATTANEKFARADLLSAVERELTRDRFVILDSMNYIKGFRYQLHCIAKGLATAQHTVYCMAKEEDVIRWNSESKQYPSEVLQGLLGRLEEPNAMNRWDSPLLNLSPDDPLPATFIHSLVHTSLQQAPSQSIALKPVAETNYLHEMDSTLKAICDAVLEAVRSGLLSGGELKVPGTDAKVLVPSKGMRNYFLMSARNEC
ncbi:chromatin associated protein KTI12 [Rhizoclosmatium globosum]|uniref:Chromatin associated protein KTI12 n=1 Tax=Rhizoclosmatium globosum TaxID=329046 RepID=A0A1Y2CJY0_9FUNG|nr:chromatin associated protein KTI12 [Rhizoclosmatium globosum]|eukprot:ORY47310.1 chromatin associated protein KTI12 [Rhizoclosmatium globosum]